MTAPTMEPQVEIAGRGVDQVVEDIPATVPMPASAAEPPTTRDILIINFSGDLEKTWATMILASTGAAMGVKTRVFVTFWGLQTFVKDSRRVTGQTWMQKMLAMMQRPGVSHRKLSKMNFLGMGPWMMRSLAKKYNVASPRDLLEAAQMMGVEFIPCQMTMDMFGITQDDFVEGMGEPVGAATVIGLITEGSAPIFI